MLQYLIYDLRLFVKILVFEYITGGGFNQQELPDSLSSEGFLMLQALLDNFSGIPGVELIVMLDWRMIGTINTAGINTVMISPEHIVSEEFIRLAKQCDAVWPIAPEFDCILQTLCQTVESLGKIVLTSPATAVAIAGNKFKTYQHLSRNNIPTIPTRMFDDRFYSHGEWMIKQVDGAGCADSYLITGQEDFAALVKQLQGNDQFIIQPHIQGNKISLSCLFKQGHGWLLCANLQKFNIINKQYHLSAIVVNHHSGLSDYQDLIADIAKALPDLWGYAGIDLIVTADQIWVLEINPRLTTSFAGIYAALGINVVEKVLQLLEGKPIINPLCNRQITIKIKQDNHAV
ncbi:MAG: ATP-grasp domain-containing protein [Methylobacter sp.]|nr:ATP-grasp domain-containing protein [Methylobacter sp.]